ncbi:MAG: hypothetical protein PHI27_13270 [Eubacteriales bacterium]|nr:hypothetical protein [Eubacteriales bacterium]MDD3883193.1 hypothetical protein [Eubacteriales bacterium]MDD4513336.1 hypothetical protein [Eubacteriales bacterium]
MKRIVGLLLALFIIGVGCAGAEGVSLDLMSDEELLQLRNDIDAELRSRRTEIPAGEYIVGSDIAAGEYALFNKGALASYLIVADGFADIYSVLRTFEIVSLSNGQIITITDAYAVPYAQAQIPALSSGAPLYEGMYEAGKHFPAGKVTLRLSGPLGAYTVYSAPRGAQAQALGFLMFTNSEVTVDVAENQFLLFSGCEMYAEGE